MRAFLMVVLVLCLMVTINGCGVIHGAGNDLQGLGRFMSNTTQKSVDNSELRRISAGIEIQNRLITKGTSLATPEDPNSF